MRLRTVLCLNNFAVGIDLLGQARNSVGGLTRLCQHLTPSGIIDPVFGLDRLPKGQAMLAELARRLRRGRSRIKHDGVSLTLFPRNARDAKRNYFVKIRVPGRSEEGLSQNFFHPPPGPGHVDVFEDARVRSTHRTCPRGHLTTPLEQPIGVLKEVAAQRRILRPALTPDWASITAGADRNSTKHPCFSATVRPDLACTRERRFPPKMRGAAAVRAPCVANTKNLQVSRISTYPVTRLGL